VLLVVGYHAGLPLPGGFVGVDIFFVISGFVITNLLLREWAAAGRIDLVRFYARRTRRLLPALALLVGVTCAVGILILPPNGRQQETAWTALGAMFISANVVVPALSGNYFADPAANNVLLHTWSLSVEEQFYLLYPALLVIGLRLGRRIPFSAPLLVSLVTVASFAFGYLATFSPSVTSSLGVFGDAFYSAPARAWEFGAGALAALAPAPLAPSQAPAGMLTGLGILVLGVAVVRFSEAMPFPGAAALLPVTGTLLLLWPGDASRSVATRALGSGLLVWIGDRSYAWYLWHWPFIGLGRWLTHDAAGVGLPCAVLSLGAAYLSTRFVENPIRFGSPALRPFTRVVLAPAGCAIVVAVVLGYGAKRGWGQEWALGSHAVLERDCESGFDPVRCRWAAPASQGSVLLAGDSQAWALADGLIPAAAALHRDTIVATNNACPFLVGPADGTAPTFLSPGCTAHNNAVLDAALRLRPSAVVVANQSAAYSALQPAWPPMLSETLRRFKRAGIGVLLVSVAPIGDEDATRTSLLVTLVGLAGASRDRFTDRDQTLRHRANAPAIDRLAVEENPGTVVFDPADVLCNTGRCVVAQAGSLFYSDRNHLSRSGALRLTPALTAALGEAIRGSTP
jgi:peptidoglycan/LPS O-acetylase OafA/YrhL